MNEDQRVLWREWNDFCSRQQKEAQGKGTVAHTGTWETKRRELLKKVVRAGLMSKDGYTSALAR